MRVALMPGASLRAEAAVRMRRGQIIHAAGVPGGAWEILSGCVRLDQADGADASWAGLATAGDIIGVEALRHGRTSYRAAALTACTLRAWRPEPGPAGQRSLLETLVQSQSRMAAMLNLRIGRAPQRVHRLLRLLMLGAMPLELPALQDMSDMTGLSIETVSRTLTQLEESGQVYWQGRQRNKRLVEIAPSLPA